LDQQQLAEWRAQQRLVVLKGERPEAVGMAQL
jgi:hypothetical protein